MSSWHIFICNWLHSLRCGLVLYFCGCAVFRCVHPLRCGLLQPRERHLLCVHRVHLPRGHVRKRARGVRRVLPRHRVHRSRAVRAAAVLLEREHTCGERGGGVGGWAGHGGGVQ
jgi:hypothetical protein